MRDNLRSTLPPRVRLNDQLQAWERTARKIRQRIREIEATPNGEPTQHAAKLAALTVCRQKAEAYEECANDLDLLIYEMEGEL